MAMEDAAREKQVNVQVEHLNKAVEALQEISNRLEASLGAVLSPEKIVDDTKEEAQKQLCEHANFLRSKANDISRVSFDLSFIIKRLEI